jgi:hypothetical protein
LERGGHWRANRSQHGTLAETAQAHGGLISPALCVASSLAIMMEAGERGALPSGAKDEIALCTELTNANPAAKPIWAQMDCVV